MYQRSELALKLKPLLAAQAKERQKGGLKQYAVKPNLAEREEADTRDNLAELAGVGHSTIDKVAYIQEHGSDNTKATICQGQKKSPRLGAEW